MKEYERILAGHRGRYGVYIASITTNSRVKTYEKNKV